MSYGSSELLLLKITLNAHLIEQRGDQQCVPVPGGEFVLRRSRSNNLGHA